MKRLKRMLAALAFVVTVSVAAWAQSSADELLKWKQLLDDGAITEAEYQAKKAELLQGSGSAPPAANAAPAQEAVKGATWETRQTALSEASTAEEVAEDFVRRIIERGLGDADVDKILSYLPEERRAQARSAIIVSLVDNDEVTWDDERVQKLAASLSDAEKENPKAYADAVRIVTARATLPLKKTALAENAEKLTDAQREKVFVIYADQFATTNPIKASWLNCAGGFGVGSFSQKNYIGFAAQACMSIIGLSMIFEGSRKENSHSADSYWKQQEIEDENDEKDTKMRNGYAVYLASYAFGFVMPFVWSWLNNSTVCNGLNVTKDGTAKAVSFIPLVNPVDNQYGLLAHLSL